MVHLHKGGPACCNGDEGKVDHGYILFPWDRVVTYIDEAILKLNIIDDTIITDNTGYSSLKLEGMFEEVNNKHQLLEERVVVLETDVATLKDELDIEVSRIDNIINVEIPALQETDTRIETLLNDTVSRVDILETKVANNADAITLCVSNIEENRNNIINNKTEIDTLNTVSENIKVDITNLTSTITDINEKIDNLISELDSIKVNVTTLTNKINNIESTLTPDVPPTENE